MPRVLLLVGLARAASVPTRIPPDAERGGELYARHCRACHGEGALGDGPLADALPTRPPPLAGRLRGADADAALEVILHGRGDMPAFSYVLNAAEARRVLVFLAGLDPETGRPAGRGRGRGKKGRPGGAGGG